MVAVPTVNVKVFPTTLITTAEPIPLVNPFVAVTIPDALTLVTVILGLPVNPEAS